MGRANSWLSALGNGEPDCPMCAMMLEYPDRKLQARFSSSLRKSSGSSVDIDRSVGTSAKRAVSCLLGYRRLESSSKRRLDHVAPTDERGRATFRIGRPNNERSTVAMLRVFTTLAIGTHIRRSFPAHLGLDIASISESARKSIHGLNGFVLVIVGQAEPPGGLVVSAHDRFGGFVTLDASSDQH